AADLMKLGPLLLGLAWTALFQAGGLWVLWRVGAAPGQEPSLGSLRRVVLEVAEQRSLALAAVAVMVILFATLGLARVVKIVTRKVALRAVYDMEVSLAATRPFVNQTRGQGLI